MRVVDFPKINPAAAEKLLVELMHIDGTSGNEQQVQDFIRAKLLKADLDEKAIQNDSAHKKSIIGGQCGNLIVKLPGTVKGPCRLLCAHSDVVHICEGSKPVKKKGCYVSDTKGLALGGDDRAGTAIILNALLQILEQDLPHPPLTFLFTVQEEIGVVGISNVAKSKLGKPAMGFNFDGWQGVISGATGNFRIEIVVHGQAAHAGGAAARGISAVSIASLAIADLQTNGWLGAVTKGKNKGTANMVITEGGTASNVVCDRVVVKAEARSHNLAFRQRMAKAMETAFNKAAMKITNDQGKRGTVDFSCELAYEAFSLAKSSPVLKLAQTAARDSGISPDPIVMDVGLDANWLNQFGIPTVTFGVGNYEAHTPEERVVVEEFLQVCQAGLLVAIR